MRVANILRYVNYSTLCIAPRARPREMGNDDVRLSRDCSGLLRVCLPTHTKRRLVYVRHQTDCRTYASSAR